MKQEVYTKAVIERLDEHNEATCEDCHKKDKVIHGIVDHDTDTLKVVCHNCFVSKYKDGLYGKEYKA